MIGALAALACIWFCLAGHLVRDGWPPIGHTQLARLCGGAGCVFGALIMAWAIHGAIWQAVVFGVAVYVGFYSDCWHAAGQGCDKTIDWFYLAVSGVTSLIPLALAAMYIDVPSVQSWLEIWSHLAANWRTGAMVLAAGLVKPPLWYSMYFVNPARWYYFLIPTRISAMLFGGWVGAVLVWLLA